MDNKVYKAQKKEQYKLRKAKKLATKKLAPEAEKIKKLKEKQAEGEMLTFAERNIINIYDKKLKTTIKRSLK